MPPDIFILQRRRVANMRKRVVSCAICILLFTIVIVVEVPKDVNAQPIIKWEKTFGGPYHDSGKSIKQTSDSGYIIVGYTSPDISLIKTDSSGNEQWSKTFHRNVYNVGYSVQQTFDGGYIIVGHTGTYSGNT